MSSHKALAQYILLLSRLKLEKETSASDPRLLRLLVCANMADQCFIAAQSAGDKEDRPLCDQEGYRRVRQRKLAAIRSKWRAGDSTALPQSGDCEHNPTGYSQSDTSLPAFSRSQASALDRVVFRRSTSTESEQLDENPFDSDSESVDSDTATFSDDGYDSESEYSSEDDAEVQTPQDLFPPNYFHEAKKS